MYINEVLSYLGAWENFNENHKNLLDEIIQACNILESNINKYLSESHEIGHDFPSERDIFGKALSELGWIDERSINHALNESVVLINLGLTKDNCFVRIVSSNLAMSSNLMSWIYSDIEWGHKNSDVSIPILLTLNFSANKYSNFNTPISRYRGLKGAARRLERVSPLKFQYPFLILGIGNDQLDIDIKEIPHDASSRDEKNIKIDRCITFEPEYYQAGLSILSYFGTVLRDKYPEQNATVRIEQHDLNVRMVIQSENGNIETIEKALQEYELVLKGETSPEEFAISPLKALELKNQLNLVKFQVESQKEIIALQNGQILDLKQIVDKALSPISHPPMTIINQLHNTQSTVINHKAEISKSNDELEELIDLADSDGLKNKLAMIQNALDINRNSDNPEDVKDSNGMKKLAKFLKEANEVGTEANSLADKGGKALELIKSLGRSYNSIAQWCGMPVIPNVFVKE